MPELALTVPELLSVTLMLVVPVPPLLVKVPALLKVPPRCHRTSRYPGWW